MPNVCLSSQGFVTPKFRTVGNDHLLAVSSLNNELYQAIRHSWPGLRGQFFRRKRLLAVYGQESSPKMRVLHITQCYTAGVAHAINNLAAATPEMEHHLLYLGMENPVGFCSVHTFERGVLSRILLIQRLIRDITPDVIHAHSSWAGLYCRIQRHAVPVLYQPHGYKFSDPTLRWSMRTMIQIAEAFLVRRCDRTIVVSENERAQARSLGVSRPVSVVPNAPTVPIVRRARVGVERHIVVMMGRACPLKGADFFASVAQRSHSTKLDLEFVWIGAGQDRAMAVLREAGVRVTGWVSNDVLQEELDRAWIYLHTSLSEGFPLSVLDAAARDVPIIVRAIPAFDGYELESVQTVNDVLDLFRQILESPERIDELRSCGQNLIAGMNSDESGSALRRAYAAARCSFATQTTQPGIREG